MSNTEKKELARKLHVQQCYDAHQESVPQLRHSCGKQYFFSFNSVHILLNQDELNYHMM